jgi:hypothetical protein
MDQELSYWIPKYILMQGDKPFTELGAMSPCMKALAKSQDIIGYCNFMGGYIFEPILCNTEFLLGHVQQLPQRSQLDKAIHLETPLCHTLPMDLLEHISTQQDQRIPLQEEVRGDNAGAQTSGRDSPGRSPRRKLIFIGDQLQQTF